MGSNTSTGILPQSLVTIRVAKLWPLVTGVVSTLLITAVVSYYDGLLRLQILRAKSVDAALYSFLNLSILRFGSQVISSISGHFGSLFRREMAHGSKRRFLRMVIEADPKWLHETDVNIQEVLNSGSQIIPNFVNQIIRMLKPITRIIALAAATTTLVGWKAGYVFLMIGTIFGLGSVLIRWDYLFSKAVEKKVAPYDKYSNHLIDTILVSILNGRGERIEKEITECAEERTKLTKKHSARVRIAYAVLETIHIALVGILIWGLTEAGMDTGTFIGMFAVVNDTCDHAWWLFFSCGDLLQQIPKWGLVESFLEEYTPRSAPSKRELTPELVVSQLRDVSEIGLSGASGAGKTTWMRNKVIECYNRFAPGGWLYLDQNMQLLKAKHKTIQTFMMEWVGRYDTADLDTLCRYACELHIDNLINRETIGKAFESPSGGETKRILILRALMPIILKRTRAKVIFSDEVTAGLDEENWQRVRRIMMAQDVKWITIDHHTFEALKATVKKRECEEAKVDVPADLVSTDHSWCTAITMSYKTEEDGDEKNEKKKPPHVWITFDG